MADKFERISYEDMFAWGYYWIGMRAISYEEAYSLFESERVYRLYENDTDEEVRRKEDIVPDAIYGVPMSDSKHIAICRMLDRVRDKDIDYIDNIGI